MAGHLLDDAPGPQRAGRGVICGIGFVAGARCW